MSKSNVICGAKNILAISMSLMLRNYFFITVKDQFDQNYIIKEEIGPIEIHTDVVWKKINNFIT